MEWKMANPAMAAGAAHVIGALAAAGHEAYWVGGCVRDELLRRPVHDMDITTSALPEEVMALFPRCVPTGLMHGTVTVLENGHGYEVTTYRTESGYADHRRPEHVEFVREVKEDLKRRDFTINAMAMDLSGRLIDPFGGAEDAREGLIRCVGDPRERFGEDALRMMRCIRFASVLDFRIDDATWRELVRARDTLAYIAIERVRAELERIVDGPHPLTGLALLRASGLHRRAKAPIPWTGEAEETAASLLQGIGELDSARCLRWALLFHALGTPADTAERVMRAWTFPAAACKAAAGVLRLREAATGAQRLAAAADGDAADEAARRQWIAAALRHGTPAAEGWLAVLDALPLEEGERRFARLARSWTAELAVRGLHELAAGGGDLVRALDRRPGPWLGKLLEQLLFQAAAGDIANDIQSLLAAAKRMESNEQQQGSADAASGDGGARK